MLFAPSETEMWEESPSKIRIQMSDSDINAKYESGEQRILTEINREKLPGFVEALKKPGYMDLRPFYQRRTRWDSKMQSRLIESFLINIPVPPVVLFEKHYNSYEVMDGQQRISALKAFYENRLKLTGLELWPELNGRTYLDLPSQIKAGIDRRSIQSIVLIAESTSDPEEALFLKQRVFERLNTGGVKLSQQEVRNCLYQGKFNSLLLELAEHPIFTEAWGIPRADHDSSSEASKELTNNTLYKTMGDAELVLRFFALRHTENFRRGLEGFLDLYMIRSLEFTDEDMKVLKNIFIGTLELAHQIYGNSLFKPFVDQDAPELDTWRDRAHKAYYDALMVSLSRQLSRKDVLIQHQARIIEETKILFREDESKLLTGAGKSKTDIQKRIKLFEDMFLNIIADE